MTINEKTINELTIDEKKDMICKLLHDKKAQDIVVIAVEHLTILGDYFIICSARSTTQTKALATHVEDKMEEYGVFLKHKEGLKESRWIVLDYRDIIVHVFLNDTREMYSLEKLWSDGANITSYPID